MTTKLWLAFTLSLGAHAGALVAWPSHLTPPVYDVERAPTSVEVLFVAHPETIITPQPTPEPNPLPEPAVVEPAPPPEAVPDPVPQTLVSQEQRGALSEVLPNYLRNPPPVYPRLARERGWEGRVRLETQVLSDGRCGPVSVLASSGYPMLDQAAASAIQRWRFRPAQRGDRAVAVWVEIPIVFRLADTF